jgi:hypothetical protein
MNSIEARLSSKVLTLAQIWMTKHYCKLTAVNLVMYKLTIALLKYFACFLVGIFFAFPISAMFGEFAILLSYLPTIWQILWRTGLGLMMLTAIALFLEALSNGAKRKS